MHERQSSFIPDLERQVEQPSQPHRELKDIFERYVDTSKLREQVANRQAVDEALRTGEIPEELSWMLSILNVMLHPGPREQVKSPRDIAAILMVQMGTLLQEQFKVVCLDTKNRIQKIHTVYQGTVNESPIRPVEVYREPMRYNSSGVIFAHSHPSGEIEPSPEDVLITRELVSAGKILGVDPLDHLIIGRGKWLSMREKGLGFDKP